MKRRTFAIVFFVGLVFGSHAQRVRKENPDQLLEHVNTRYDEQNPVLGPDGKKLYFTRANDSLNIGGPGDKGDIWVSELNAEGFWSEPVNLGRPVNDDLRNYLLGFSPDGKIMFLNQEKRNPGGIIINDGVAYSVYSNGGWSRPVKASVDYFLNKSRHQSGSISGDGSVMLLSLQSYASRGEEDIYVSFYKNGTWTQPVNLGSDINTGGQEMTPYLSPDKRRLYFSSNGHGGKGGRDLFVAERVGAGWTSWSKPKNLGAQVNSFGVELNYFIDATNDIGYFSSTQNSDGYGDIKAHDISVEIEEPPVAEEKFEELVTVIEAAGRTILFSGIVTNGNSSEPIAAALNIKTGEIDEYMNTDKADGKFELELPVATQHLIAHVKAPGFMSATEQVAIGGKSTTYDFSLIPLEVGATIRLNNVYFQRGTSDLLDDSFAELDQVVDMMEENPTVKIELLGHTDNQGSSKLNLKLSQERVDKVKMYMTEHGIASKRIKGKGYGGSRPVASNASEETRKLNRRVEIKILKN
ncbi:MAG: OmpA family protein [Cytophagales bacterium]|nr:OmpA family protein [Cytophagales bacterium]